MKEVDFVHKSVGGEPIKPESLSEEERRKRDLEKSKTEKGDPTETDLFK